MIPDKFDGLIDAEDFERQLRTKWPMIEFFDPGDNFLLFWWIRPEGGSWQEGSLHSNRKIVTFEESEDEVVAATAFWIRSIIPAHYPLEICHDSESVFVELTADLPAKDLLRKLHPGG
jgi:hypothetical protein